MAKKRKPLLEAESAERRETRPIFDSPFKDLKKLVKGRPPAVPRPAPTPKHAFPTSSFPAPPPLDETALFHQAFEGIRRLDGPSNGTRVAIEPRAVRKVVSEDAEVLAQLSDLVSGQAPFELTETDEYIEGARVGLDPRLVSRLRRGEFATQGHIDLHGLTQPDAKEALNRFIIDSIHKGWRAVLVVHGRGLRSPGGQPVLKHATAQWLSHGAIGGYVLAFTSARAYDGGVGAVWVLLRRERKRGKFDILQGAKRRD